jgi:hypothetical protein
MSATLVVRAPPTRSRHHFAGSNVRICTPVKACGSYAAPDLANVNNNLNPACAVPGILSWARVNAAAIRRLDSWHKFGTVGGGIERSRAKPGDIKYLILQDFGEARP